MKLSLQFLSRGIIRFFTMSFLFLAGLQLQAQCTDPTPIISGDFSVCPSEEVLYSVEEFNPANTYEFAISGGGTVSSVVDGTVTISFGNIAGSYELSVTETDGICSGTDMQNIVIEADAVLICNDNLNISLADNCELVLTPDVILEAPSYPDDSYSITVLDEDGNPTPVILGVDYVGQTLEVTVEHICSGNTCWGEITLEDKLAPQISCENDTLTCDEFAAFVQVDPIITSDNCGDAVITFEIEDDTPDCDSPYALIRSITYIATDGSGNSSAPCTQEIYVERDSLQDVFFPLNYDGLPGNNNTLSCSGNYPLNDDGYPDPSFTGIPGINTGCSTIEYTYNDILLPLCNSACTYTNSNYKLIRTFIAVDWCTGEVREESQIIKVEDTEAPVFDNISDLTMSVNPFDCSAQVILPTGTASDNCTDAESLTYTYSTDVGEIINGVLYVEAPAKTMNDPVIVTVTATDCCGNTGETTFELTLVDTTPPVVVADSHETISLLPSGSATMYATSLDDGSYDNCGPIEISVKRVDNGSGNSPIDLFPPTGNDNGQFNEVVHFFCSDIDPNNPVMVILQVCDDANMDGEFGNNGDNCNTAMIEVEVQDKYAPIISGPPDMTINCIEFQDIDINDQDQLNELFGEATAIGTCSPTIEQNSNGSSVLNCGEGFILRNFSATTVGGTATYTQTISVSAYNNNLLTCDRITFEGLNNSIYNWCEVNDNDNDNDDDLPAIDIDGCEGISVAEVNINTQDLCTTAAVQTSIDTFNYAGSTACKKYLVQYEVIDQCIFNENYVDPNTGQIDPFNSDNGYFEFYLEYNVVDTDAPDLTCESVEVIADICEGYTGTISIEATDACTPDELLQYEFRIDVGADGTVDLPFNGTWFSGNAVTGASLGLTAIPPGDHIILWKVDDGCGNQETCSQTISIEEKDKAPTPYCLGGLSTAVMNTNGMITIEAISFDNGSEDDCGSALNFSVIPAALAETLNNPFNQSTPTWTFGCEDIPNGISELIELRVYVEDETGAFDYCTVTLQVEDNEANFCTDDTSMGMIAGAIVTEGGLGLKDATVKIESVQPEFPAVNSTEIDGEYSFDVFLNHDYELSAQKNNDFLEGVTTLDIVLIQKHILGIGVLESPYKLIASDVNNDCIVSGLDIIQVRKLLLGFYEDGKFPNNESWRFIDEGQNFDPLIQPCDFNEKHTIGNLSGNSMDNNFIAVKVADINESFDPELDSGNPDVRSANELSFVIENKRYKANEVIRIPVYANNMSDVMGFQFTIAMENMMINGVERGALPINRNYVGMQYAEEGLLSVSYNDAHGINIDADEVLFTILATATEDSALKEVVSLTNEILVNESYVGDNLEIGNVAFELRDGTETMLIATAFNLLQNEPNPFANQTNIGFELPVSGEAILKIYDLQGKLLFAKKGSFSNGYNTITVNKSDIGITGELFYQLEFQGQVQTKKMILLQ